jgi:hypothetical protein
MGTIATNQNCIQENIKGKLLLGDATIQFRILSNKTKISAFFRYS